MKKKFCSETHSITAIKFFAFSLMLSFLISCKQSPTVKNEKPPTPEALQDNSSDFKSSRYSNDLVEDLYSEIKDKKPALQQFEKDIVAFNDNNNKLRNDFTVYNDKSESYYNRANYKTAAIKDSILKQHILGLIDESKTLYTNRTSKLNDLIKNIEQSRGNLSDRQLALKIILTLPAIESYQANEMPDKSHFEKLLNEVKQLIAKGDSLGSLKK